MARPRPPSRRPPPGPLAGAPGSPAGPWRVPRPAPRPPLSQPRPARPGPSPPSPGPCVFRRRLAPAVVAHAADDRPLAPEPQRAHPLALEGDAAAQRAAVREHPHARDPRGTPRCPEAFPIAVHHLRRRPGKQGLSVPAGQGPGPVRMPILARERRLEHRSPAMNGQKPRTLAFVVHARPAALCASLLAGDDYAAWRGTRHLPNALPIICGSQRFGAGSGSSTDRPVLAWPSSPRRYASADTRTGPPPW